MSTFSIRSMRLVPTLLLAVGMLDAHCAPVAEAWARVSAPGPFSEFYTNLPETPIWANGSAQNFYLSAGVPSVPVGYGPTAYGNAHASTSIGASRIKFDAQFVRALEGYPPDAVSASGSVYVDAGASSRWFDTWTITGLPLGSQVTLNLSGTVDFSLYGSLNWPRRLPGSYSIQYSLLVQGGEALTLATSDFDIESGPQTLDWSYSLQWTAGDPLIIGALFSGVTSAGNAAAANSCTLCIGDFFFDSMSTATLGLIYISDGAGITSDSGLLVRSPSDNSFYYPNVFTPPIPEPHSGVMMLSGLFLLASLMKTFASRRNDSRERFAG